MIAWWMAQLLLLGSLLALAAFGAESALAVARRQTRWVWAAALGLTVALGALAPTRLAATASAARAWQAEAAVTTPAMTVTHAGLLDHLGALWSTATTRLDDGVRRAWTAWHGAMPDGIERTLLVVWGIASLALLIAFVTVHLRYQRRRAQWPVGEVLGTTVRIAGDTGPAVIGVTSAEIVLPQWLLARDAKEQRLVLEHELEHVRQHDPLLLAAAQVAVVLLPWHPAVWWMAGRLRLAIELDCDRRVLQRGASARDYGSLLIDLTDHRTRFGAALPAFSCSPSHLERRLVAMTPARLKYPIIRALTTGALASLALLAACEAKLPTSEEMDGMTAATATQAAGRVAMIDTAAVTYFVNDAVVTKEQANAIMPDSIATVNVVKGSGAGEIRILTKNATGPTRATYTTLRDTTTMIADTVIVRHPGVSVLRRPSSANVNIAPGRFTGLLIIDGVARESSAMNTLAPDRIESVNVMKGAAAAARYTDPRAANGVIEITTKKATP